ncbi:MAG TPA: MFS transporter [Clostridia bacterium]|nr:MFS transporter [Clostridia bacterium]
MMNKIIYKHFPALTYRDYWLFWTGQCISLIGTWMQTVGQAWLVYQITDSSYKLGIISALQFMPMLLFSLPVGAIIDRQAKKRLLFIVQAIMAVNALVLALLVWTGLVSYRTIALQAILLGILNCIDMPVRQSFMVELASREHLMNAIALNSTIFNAARVIGPAVAGLAFSYFGATVCFLMNGLSFIPVLYNISRIQAEGKSKITDGERVNIYHEIWEGLKYIAGNPVVNTTILMLAFSNIIILNFNVLIPVMAKTVLMGDSRTYGFLLTALGLGAFTGALLMAATSYKGLKIKSLMGAYMCLSIFVFITGFQTEFLYAFIALMLSGWWMTTALSSSNTCIQTNSPDNMRGRIMSVYTLVQGGAVPFGSMYSGILTEHFGVGFTFRASGLAGMVFMLAVIAFRYKLIAGRRAEERSAI